MIGPHEALEIVLRQAPRLDAVLVPLAEAAGGVLAERVESDIDLPPFDKSAMDGYSVRAADVQRLPADLAVIESLPAGTAPARPLAPGTCAKTMTGAPVSPGAGLVIPVEDTETLLDGRVRILRVDVGRTHICLRGEDVRRGETVLEAGSVLRPQEVALLASVGRDPVPVFRRPRVAVLATGEELVPVSAVPGPGQIRNANSSSLLACCRAAGVPADDLGVARDEKGDLRAKIAEGLARDVLLVSGGVSMGDWDLVPKVLQEAGVTIHFATVRMKPGKPTVFGTRHGCAVFGLAGNPVSTLVGFHLLVRPCLRKMMGRPDAAPEAIEARLLAPAEVKDDRVIFQPAILRRETGGWTARPVETHGPADLVGFSKANGLIVLESGRYEASERVPAMLFEP
ncbi:MAG: molybdopterin molybdotransferase MoeA [Planctomycetota bacterium]|nr:molybdopterin molybdotransferase MoeA [Planctomycetota bacterium]